MSEETKENSTHPQGQEPTQKQAEAIRNIKDEVSKLENEVSDKVGQMEPSGITEIAEWAVMEQEVYNRLCDIIRPFKYDVQMKMLERVKATYTEAQMHHLISKRITPPRPNNLTPDQIKEGMSNIIKTNPNPEALKARLEKVLDKFDTGSKGIEITCGSHDGTKGGNVTGEEAANIIRSLLEDMKQKP